MALTKWQPPAFRHSVAEDGRVTWLELFFDLVYVAALIQLGDRLADDVSWRGVAAFIGVFVVLWWTWTGTTAYLNQFAVDDVTHRVLAFVQMSAVGTIAVIAASRPDDWQMWFALAYVAARLPLLAMYWRAARRLPESRAWVELLSRYFGLSLVLWIVSIFVPGNARYVIWVLALAIEFGTPLKAARRETAGSLHAEHLQERYALFTIIVLGETFVKSLSAVTSRGISIETQVFGGIGFFILIALWWTYFDDVADAEVREESALSKLPWANNLIWIYTHLPLAAAITGFGVAAKKAISVDQLGDALKTNYLWLMIGTLIVALVSVAILDLVTRSPHFAINAPERVGPRIVAALALLVLGFVLASTKPSAVVSLGLIAVIVIAQIAVEVISAAKSDHRLDREVRGIIEDTAGSCEHLSGFTPPQPPEYAECEECEATGQHSVQMRWCMICGHRACCDSSEGQHARKHYNETGHALLASLEPGDDWGHCYVHDVSVDDYVVEA